MNSAVKFSGLLTLLVLAIGAVPCVLQERRLNELRGEFRVVTAEAAASGEAKHQRGTLAADWIALFKQREQLEKNGAHLDFFSDESLFRAASPDVAQLSEIIAQVLASQDISDESKSAMVAAAIRKIADRDPQTALDLWLENHGLLGEGDDLLVFTLDKLAELDPKEAVAWIRENPAPLSDISSVAETIAVTDPRLAFDLLEGKSPADSAEIVESIAGSATTPENGTAVLAALRDYLAGVSDPNQSAETRDAALEALGRGIAPQGIDTATCWIDGARLTAEEKSGFATGLTYSATGADTGRWIDWLAANVPPEDASAPVASLVSDWTHADYRASGTWLANAPESPAKHSAVIAYAGTIAEYEPRVASQWAMTLPPGPERQEALQVIFKNWPGNDPQGSAAFAKEHGIE